MTWNAKVELVKKACDIAVKKYPDGFGKAELIGASKEVYGGFGEVAASGGLLTKEIKTMEDIANMANAMSEIDGHYPRGMSGCFVVGINGGCGPTCPVYLAGQCDESDEMIPRLDDEDEIERHYELYGNRPEEVQS